VRQVEREVGLEIVGSSDASSGQRFALSHLPIIDDSLRVTVREGDSELEWTRVETLLFSGPTDRHYQIRRDEGERAFVEFGSGTQGMIPAWGVDNVVASYLVGGGARGNVAPNTIVKPGELAASVSGLRRAGHDDRASGGADREALEVAARRAPYQFRSQDRAVTAADYEAHALEFGVAKARAFSTGWNRVELFVAPAGGGHPSKTLKEQLLRYLDQRRVMTTIVEIKDPEYVGIDITLTVGVEPAYFKDEVRNAVARAVRSLLAFERVDFEQVLHVSKFYEAIEAIPGVESVYVSHLNRRGASEDFPAGGRLELAARQLPILNEDSFALEAAGGLDRG
jgi:predicted phage baseplate assembly protein